MVICMCVDPCGTSVMEPDEELDFIERILRLLLPGDHIFKRDVFPYMLVNQPCDLYVFDFGGMMPGSESMVESHYQEMIRQIQDRPSTVFLLWSTFTMKWYQEIVEMDFPEFVAPNVVFTSEDDEWEKTVVRLVKGE